MKALATALPGVVVIEPQAFADDRGFFFESWNRRRFTEVAGVDVDFVQDNHSRSRRDVLRGIHYQLARPQGKLVRVVRGAVYDVAVDLRRSSPTFLRWIGAELTEQNRRQLWIPPGFGHGFLVLSEEADVLYKTTEFWFAQHERSLRWDDPRVAIDWPLDGRSPVLARKDAGAPGLDAAEVFN